MLAHTARRTAGVFFGLALLIVLFSGYVALVYHGDVSAGADWIVEVDFGIWIAIFAVSLAFCFLVLLILFLAPVTQPAAQGLVGGEVTITCRDCSREYIIVDTGERPLLHACPHCGFTDQYPGGAQPAEVEAIPEGTPVGEPAAFTATPAGPDALVLHCPNCGTNFETTYTDERPLVLNCANCGKRGILRATAATYPAGMGGGAGSTTAA